MGLVNQQTGRPEEPDGPFSGSVIDRSHLLAGCRPPCPSASTQTDRSGHFV